MDKLGIHLVERAVADTWKFDRQLSIIRFLQLLRQRSLEGEQVKIEGLDFLLNYYPSLGGEIRQSLVEAENYLFNRKASLVFVVERVLLGEHPKLTYQGKDTDLLPVFGSMVPEGKGHLYTPRL